MTMMMMMMMMIDDENDDDVSTAAAAAAADDDDVAATDDDSCFIFYQGQRWVNATRTCMTRSLLSLYQRDRQSCRMVWTSSLSSISDCYLEAGFCEIMWDNREALWKVYEFDELMDRLSALR
jgi:hypothetical protein